MTSASVGGQLVAARADDTVDSLCTRLEIPDYVRDAVVNAAGGTRTTPLVAFGASTTEAVEALRASIRVTRSDSGDPSPPNLVETGVVTNFFRAAHGLVVEATPVTPNPARVGPATAGALTLPLPVAPLAPQTIKHALSSHRLMIAPPCS